MPCHRLWCCRRNNEHFLLHAMSCLLNIMIIHIIFGDPLDYLFIYLANLPIYTIIKVEKWLLLESTRGTSWNGSFEVFITVVHICIIFTSLFHSVSDLPQMSGKSCIFSFFLSPSDNHINISLARFLYLWLSLLDKHNLCSLQWHYLFLMMEKWIMQIWEKLTHGLPVTLSA